MTLNIRQFFKQVWAHIYKNKYAYMFNTALLQIIFVTVGTFLLSELFGFVLALANQVNLDKNNVFVFLTNPLSLLGVVLYFIGLAFLMFLEFSLLTLMVYGKQQNTNFSFRTVLKHSFMRVRRLRLKDLCYFVVYLLVTIPVANIGLVSSFTEKLYIPTFITGEFMKTNIGMIAVTLGAVLSAYLNIRFIYTLPLTVINEQRFSENMKQSWRMTKRNKFKWIGTILLYEAVLFLISIVFIMISVGLTNLIDQAGTNLWIQAGTLTVLKGLVFFGAILTKIGVIIVLLTIISEQNQVSHELRRHPKEATIQPKMLTLFIIAFITGSYAINMYRLQTLELNPETSVIAHRGYIAEGVENSIEALEAAAKQGVEYVEMDILLTKDNQFVVMHDYNLKRLAGINRKVQDMLFSEVVGLPIYQDGHSSTIPSFEQYVAKAKELNVKLLVELKPHGAEPNHYAQLFIEKMRELKVENDYPAMSLDLKVMEEINQLAPEIQVGYVIPIQFGSFADNHVDFYVIEDFSYRHYLADQALQQNKQLYVWTINDEEKIMRYLHRPVSGIITDMPDLVNQSKQDIEINSNYFDRLLRLVDVGL